MLGSTSLLILPALPREAVAEVASASPESPARLDPAAPAPAQVLTSIRLLVPGAQWAFTSLAEADNQSQISLVGISLIHQRRRLVLDVSSVVNLSSGKPDFALRGGYALLKHDSRQVDAYGAPVGWLVQGQLLAGYRYLDVDSYARHHRLSAQAALDVAYFPGGDRLGVGARLAAGQSWALGGPSETRAYTDLSLALGVTF